MLQIQPRLTVATTQPRRAAVLCTRRATVSRARTRATELGATRRTRRHRDTREYRRARTRADEQNFGKEREGRGRSSYNGRGGQREPRRGQPPHGGVLRHRLPHGGVDDHPAQQARALGHPVPLPHRARLPRRALRMGRVRRPGAHRSHLAGEAQGHHAERVAQERAPHRFLHRRDPRDGQHGVLLPLALLPADGQGAEPRRAVLRPHSHRPRQVPHECLHLNHGHRVRRRGGGVRGGPLHLDRHRFSGHRGVLRGAQIRGVPVSPGEQVLLHVGGYVLCLPRVAHLPRHCNLLHGTGRDDRGGRVGADEISPARVHRVRYPRVRGELLFVGSHQERGVAHAQGAGADEVHLDHLRGHRHLQRRGEFADRHGVRHLDRGLWLLQLREDQGEGGGR